MALLSPWLQAAESATSGSQAEQALAELLAMLAELDADFSRPEWRLRTPQDFAEARRLLLYTLIHGLQVWMEADPARPFFTPFTGAHKKLLGDNPDARYHSAVIDGNHRCRIFGNLADAAYAAADNVYAMAPFVLQPNQALVMTGRFPRARFGNVMLWNQFMQTFDYETRQVSLNRQQIALESDGCFRIVIAHEDPGTPNWLDTEGRLFGMVFWRFLLPEEAVDPIKTEVITL